MQWLTKESRDFLSKGYLLEGVTPEERIRQMADRAEELLGIEGFGDEFYQYMSEGLYSLASPIWSNFGLGRGLPISCYGSTVPDTMIGILKAATEVGIMSKQGGGTSADVSRLRPRGSTIKDNGFSEGSVNFLRLFDTLIDVTKQGGVRRGAFSPYLDADHGDFDEFLSIKSEGSPIQGLFPGIKITDDFMRRMIADEGDARRRWVKILKSRFETGLPYLFFTDNFNNHSPDVYQDKGLTIKASNLCTEIALSATDEESFVCDLSSLNLTKWDRMMELEGRPIKVLTYFLDAVMSEFIEKTVDMEGMEKAHRFAVNQRALGVGVLGWHDLLQDRMIPFDSFQAMSLNNQIFSQIEKYAQEASVELALEFGEPELLKGYGRRNVTLTALAPTKSSSFILGQTSPSIEPIESNYHVKDLAKSKTSYRNPRLVRLLKEREQDTPEVWRSILEYEGSVQHLEFLTDEEKEVFKTFSEISQMSIIQQAAQRQKYIDQAQSINLRIHPNTPLKDVNQLYIRAWELGVKSLYYQKGVNAAQELNRELMHSCSSCEA